MEKPPLQLRPMARNDRPEVLSLWNSAGAALGYVPTDEAGLAALVFDHPDMDCECAFVLTAGEKVVGFVCGCTSENMAQGETHGYIACLLLDKDRENTENARMLLDAAEDVFCRRGKQFSGLSYKCPVRLPWTVPGTPGHQHNIMPGVPVDSGLYSILTRLGYSRIDEEVALYLPLENFSVPQSIADKQAQAAREGYTIDWYEDGKYTGLEQMLESLGHYRWITEIPRDCREGRDVLLALKGNVIAGFSGPVYPEPTGRGYLAGLGVDPRFQGHGLGKILFYRLCEAERDHGATYMSIFTESDNRARRIYEEMGFEPRRFFGVMEKKL